MNNIGSIPMKNNCFLFFYAGFVRFLCVFFSFGWSRSVLVFFCLSVHDGLCFFFIYFLKTFVFCFVLCLVQNQNHSGFFYFLCMIIFEYDRKPEPFWLCVPFRFFDINNRVFLAFWFFDINNRDIWYIFFNNRVFLAFWFLTSITGIFGIFSSKTGFFLYSGFSHQ